MTKFKVGDKVKRIGHSNGEMIYGEVYTVEKSSPFGVKARGLSFSGYEPSNFELVETANSWDNCKIRIKDAEHSRIVQEEAFRKGFRWGIINKKVSHTDTRALYFERGEITFTERASTYFESKPSREIFFDGTQTEEFKQTNKEGEKMNKPKTNLEKEACKKAKKEAIEKAIDTKKVVYADAMTHYISAQNSANNYQAQADEYVETLGITPAQKAELF